jgi:hypothetical protein
MNRWGAYLDSLKSAKKVNFEMEEANFS